MKEIVKELFKDDAFLASFILFILFIIVSVVVFDIYYILQVLLGCAIGFILVGLLQLIIRKVRKAK